jgi:hypothetical protein
MDNNMNRWLVSSTWIAAVLALVSAASQGAMGVVALWSLPVAIGVTVASMGWPDKPAVRVVAALGAIWQVALIGAYWPFASSVSEPSSGGGAMSWPIHSIVILVVLILLAISFVALYMIPAMGLSRRIRQAVRIVSLRQADTVPQVSKAFQKDLSLSGLWSEYVAQIRQPSTSDASAQVHSYSSARIIFEPTAVVHSRLRLDFFRNLPGVLTGIGIIGTFSGLIAGLRTFRISQDPTVVQRSLEVLLGGVWEAFLISALAIAMAIVVTVIEKLMSSSLSFHLETLAVGLDNIFPPRPQAESEDWAPKLLEALSAMEKMRPAVGTYRSAGVLEDARAFIHSQSGTDSRPMALEQPLSASNAALLGAVSGSVPELTAHLLEMANNTRDATAAMGHMASRMPELLTQSVNGSVQSNQQAAQAMKALSARLESVASGIEFSARKTLETVAARLMQAEMNMVSRHQAVGEHMGELVQRIETLCGLLQQDRADIQRSGGMGLGDFGTGQQPMGYGGGNGYAPQSYGQSGDNGYRAMPPPQGGRQYAPPQGGEQGYGEEQSDDTWYDPGSPAGFGS